MFIKKSDKIGVTATSGGVTNLEDIKRFENAKNQLSLLGYETVFTNNVFKSDDKGRSSDKITRAKEFMELIEDEKIKCIITAKGGEFLCEILPYIDFDKINNNKKFVQGFSDTTGILYSITTKTGIPTIYSSNFGDFGMEKWHRSIEENFKILQGELIEQKSFDYYEEERHERITGLEGIFEDKKVLWKAYDKELKEYSKSTETLKVSGILLGGCLDVLIDIAGTPYEDTLNYIKNQKQKILWYLESFQANSEDIIRGLWKLKSMGWFDNAKGFIFGRPLFTSTSTETSYEEACIEVLKDLHLPMIFDCDLGHKSPKMTFVNGFKGEITYKQGKGSLKLYKI